MPAPKQPQDRKPKGVSAAKRVAAEATKPAFKFDHDGKVYELPHASDYVNGVVGGDLMDAMLDGDEQAEMRLSLSVLKAAKPDIAHDAWTVLRAKPINEFLQVVGEWMQAGGGAPGES